MPRKRLYNVLCKNCGLAIRMKSGKYNKIFCSEHCKNKFYIGSNHPAYRKGRFISDHGYVMVLKDGCGTYEFEHRRIIEEKVGRELTKDDVVHHIDGNRSNNAIENLVLTTHAGHGKLHVGRRCPFNQKYEILEELPTELILNRIVSIKNEDYRSYKVNKCRCCEKLFWTRLDYNSKTCSNRCGHTKYVRTNNDVGVVS